MHKQYKTNITQNHPLLSLFSSHIIEYPTPINLNYIWSFGSAAGICLVIQIITGIFLAMYYTCLLYTSPSPRDGLLSRMPSSA